MSQRPDKYEVDADFGIIDRLKEKGLSIIRDNSIERGPLKAIYSHDRIMDTYKYFWTTSHATNMAFAFKNQKMPLETDEYPTDTPRHWAKQMEHPVSRKLLTKLNWNGPNGEFVYIPYKINKQGFRHDGSCIDILSDTGGVMYFGDSHTMGVGMPIEETFTYLAHKNCKYTKNLRYLNMGCPGYGIDSYYRLIRYFVPKVKPHAVIVTYPWNTTRTEMWHVKYNHWVIQTLNKFGRRWLGDTKDRNTNDKPPIELFHTSQSYVRWFKNVEAIKWICYSNDCKVYFAEEEQRNDKRLQKINNKYSYKVDKDDFARDLVHAGRLTHAHNGKVLEEALTHIFEKDII